MGIPYTVHFTAHKYFEHEEDEWTEESALESFSDLLSSFHDVSIVDAEPREDYGRVLGYDAEVQVEYRGEAEISDSFPNSYDALALAVLADFREQVEDHLDEVEQMDRIVIEFRPFEHSSPIQFVLSQTKTN